MDRLSLRLTETLSVGKAFEAADSALTVQIARLGDDDARWALVRHLADRFAALAARHDGLQVMVHRAYDRDFSLQELKEMTVEKRALAAEIKRVMDELGEGLDAQEAAVPNRTPLLS